MAKVFIDADFHCHTSAGDGLKEVETKFFNGKCSEFIEGYRYIPPGERWTREDGTVFDGEMISPWKPWEELDRAQRAYEREQLANINAQLSELDSAYTEGVNSIS